MVLEEVAGPVCRTMTIPSASADYFNFAPMGTSSRNPASTGLPSSPTATLVDMERALLCVLGRPSAQPEIDDRPDPVASTTSAAYLAEIGRLLGELAV